MSVQPHYLPELLLGLMSAMAALWLGWVVRKQPRRRRILIQFVLYFTASLVVFTGLLATIRVSRLFPSTFVAWIRCCGVFASAWVVYIAVLVAASRIVPPVRPERRRFLKLAAGTAVAAPAALATFAIVKREDLVFREVEVKLPSVRADLDGLRIVQLSDIHLSPFVSERLLAQAVGVANETNAHIALVTGDLISMKGDPLDKCLGHLFELKADAGVFGCMGNHEAYTFSEQYVQQTAARRGMRFLRSESVRLLFGDTPLVLSGVDYQRRGRPYLQGAEALVSPGEFNVLLSHNPDVFPTAVRKGFDLTISGHTHGGQVNFEMVHPALNVGKFITPYVYGVFERDGKGLYVTRGIGTIGVPARLGAPPEVALIRLCAT